MVKNSKLDNTFTTKKVKAAFNWMGSYKGAGPDGIKLIIMKFFGPIALRCINFLFKAIYSTGYIPLEFRKSRVVFIPKPFKQDGIDSQRPMPPPTAFSVPNRNVLYLRETKLWRCGNGRGGGRGETCHLLTHAPARGMGKNTMEKPGHLDLFLSPNFF